MAQDARLALLGAQNHERPEQAAQEPALESQAGAAGDLDVPRPRRMRLLVDAIVETWGVKYDKAVEC